MEEITQTNSDLQSLSQIRDAGITWEFKQWNSIYVI